MAGESDLAVLLREMEPVLNSGTYVFATVPSGRLVHPDDIVACVRETEGLSVVVEQSRASELGLAGTFSCAWITLRVHSDLAAVGLTAAVSAALAAAGISCNVIAGTCHDHLFVPIDRGEEAVVVLRAAARASV